MRENPFKVEYRGWPMTVTVREIAEAQYAATVRIGPTPEGVDALLPTPDNETFNDPEDAGTYAAQMGRQYIDKVQAERGVTHAETEARTKAQMRWVNTYVQAYVEAAGGAADHDATFEEAYRLWRACASRDPVAVARSERIRHEAEFESRPTIPAEPGRFEY